MKTDDAIEAVKKNTDSLGDIVYVDGHGYESDVIDSSHVKTILRALTLLKNYEGMERKWTEGLYNAQYDAGYNAALDELKSKMEE